MTAAQKQTAIAAAPSLRRGSNSCAEPAHTDFLNLAGLRVTSPPEEDEFTIWTRAEQFPKLWCCPFCGCDDERFKRNGTRPQIYRDAPHGLRSLYVEVHRQSYYCRQCRKPCQHPLTTVSDKWRMTSRLVEYISKLSLLRPAREVALLTGASTDTVREILKEYCQELDSTVRFETPRVLGLDGVFARVKDKKGRSKRKECAIITDIAAGLVIDLHPGATIDEVCKRLRDLPERERVEIVVIDMSHALASAVKRALPHALVVIDLFHIQSKINEGLDQVRVRLRKKATRRKGQLTMCRKELLRKRRDQLTPDERKELDMWFELQPELKLAYETVEKCLEIWHSSSSATARERYRRWLAEFPPELRQDFSELLSAFRNWRDYIFNYFDCRFTNAFTESSNRLVKDIQRETRGCDFETLRAKVVYGTLLKKQMKEARCEEMRRKKRKPRPQVAVKRRRRRGADAAAEQKATLALAPGQLTVIQMDLFG